MIKKLIVLMYAAMFSGVVLAGMADLPPPPEMDPTDEKGRWIVCHKGKKTLAVEGESKADHLGHGDVIGECSSDN